MGVARYGFIVMHFCGCCFGSLTRAHVIDLDSGLFFCLDCGNETRDFFFSMS